MADGSVMRARSDQTETEVSIEEAIRRLEAGNADGLVVDLGDGRKAVADGHRGNEGLLQRLRGHTMMQALATGSADLSRFDAANDGVKVAPQVQEILDAAIQRD